MTRITLTFATLALLVTPACKKKDAASGGAGESAKTADKTAAPKAACAPDAVKNADGGFCLKVPAAWTEKPVQDMGHGSKVFQYNKNENTYGVSIHVDPLEGGQSAFDMKVDMTDKMLKVPDNKNLQTGDIPGGGKFWTYQDADGLWVKTMTHSDKAIFDCGTRQSPTDSSPEKPALLEACKTLVAL